MITRARSQQNSDPFEQICVWQGAPLGSEHGVDAALSLKLLEHFGFRVQHKDTVVTLPGGGGPGGRTDIFFGIHNDDVSKFAVARFNLLQSTSSRVYGMMFKQGDGPTIDEQKEYFHSRGVASFCVDVEFDSLYVFSFRLFDVDCEDENKQEEQAQEAVEKFVAACKAFEETFSHLKPAQMLCSGNIRWWEDVCSNMQHHSTCIYAQHIMEKHKPRW